MQTKVKKQIYLWRSCWYAKIHSRSPCSILLLSRQPGSDVWLKQRRWGKTPDLPAHALHFVKQGLRFEYYRWLARAAVTRWRGRRKQWQRRPSVENSHLASAIKIAKLQLNSQLHLHSNPTQSPLQVNSTPPRVELELCPIFGFHHPPTTTTHHITFLN